MTADYTEYDDRYLVGILLFNQGDFFEAHEVWEKLWLDGTGPDRSFYQGLIQAAVALCHYCNGNIRGAAKLYHTSWKYLRPFGPNHLGIDLVDFERQLYQCFAPILTRPDPGARPEPDEALFPILRLDPPPVNWPDPEVYREEGHD